MPHYLDKRYGVNLAEAYAEAATSAPLGRTILYTYELIHPSFTEKILIVNDFNDLRATLEDGTTHDFTPCPVTIVPPEESDEAKTPTIHVQIDGVSSIIATQLEVATKQMARVEIVERIYVSDDLSGPAVLPPLRLTLKTVNINYTQVTGEASFSDPINRGFPKYDYLIREYPGLSAK